MDVQTVSRRLRRFPAVVVIAVVMALTACGAPPAPRPEPPPSPEAAQRFSAADVDAWLDGLVPDALEREGIAGATVAVVRDGAVVTQRGFGWSDVDRRIPVDPDRTLFRIGSVSKVVTATAVMQQVERGSVDLDADVATYLDFPLPTRFATPVTLRHLLTHTAGFEERAEGLIGGPGTRVDLRTALATDPPDQVYEPGTVPAYSNYGNSLAGYIVQQVTGEPFEQYVARHITGPAGMASSTFAQPVDAGLEPRLSQGYPDSGADPVPFEVVGTPPAGAFSSSAADMARFMLAQLGSGAGQPLLQPETLALMHAPALDERSLGGLAAGQRMTLGFFDRSRNGHRIIEHGGDTTVFHSDLELYPDDATGIFVSFNSTGTDPVATAVLRRQVLEGFADRYFPGATSPAPDLDPSTTRAQAATVAGTYESARAARSTFLTAAYAVGPTTITADGDGRLTVSPGSAGRAAEAYEPVGAWTWRQVDGDGLLAVRVVEGRVEAVGLDSAFALVPVPAERAVVVPLLAGSTVLLVLCAVGGAVALLRSGWRRLRGADPSSGPAEPGRLTGLLGGIGVVAALLGLAGWVVLISAIMGVQTPPMGAIRAVQVVQLLGVVAVVPAVGHLVLQLRQRAGGRRIGTAASVVVGLAGVGWSAVVLRLLSPDISY